MFKYRITRFNNVQYVMYNKNQMVRVYSTHVFIPGIPSFIFEMRDIYPRTSTQHPLHDGALLIKKVQQQSSSLDMSQNSQHAYKQTERSQLNYHQTALVERLQTR